MTGRGWWLVLASLSGCVSIAPPVRGLPGGMPDRVAYRALEVGGNAGALFVVDERGKANFTAPTVGGPHVAYGVLEHLVLEAGVNMELRLAYWVTHWLGARLVHRVPFGEWVFSMDGELGAGAGAANLKTSKDFIAGGYTGGGLGLRWHWLGFFARARIDLSQAANIETTLWPSFSGGVEARAGVVNFSLGGGAIAQWMPGQRPAFIGLMQFGISLIFDLTPPKVVEARR